MKPDVTYLLFVGVLQGAFGESACNAAATKVRMNGYICDKIGALFVMSKWDEAGVADDLSFFIPNVAALGQGCSFSRAAGPLNKRIIFSCAAHILHVTFAFAIHRTGEARLNEIGHCWKITKNV
jgi:hypothetical protein